MHSEPLVSFLVELLAKSALILLAAALLQRAWTRASAAQRHLVWCAALGTILLLPLTRSVAPRWSVPLVRVTATLPTRDALPQVPPVQTRAESIMPAAAPSRQWHGPDWRTIVGVGWAVGTIGLLAPGIQAPGVRALH